VQVKSFVSKLAKEGQVPLHQVSLKTADGYDFWFLILATKSRIRELKEQILSQPKLEEFGKVIYSGFGTSAPAYLLQKVSTDYNLDIPAAA
jgi:hypothetical protein